MSTSDLDALRALMKRRDILVYDCAWNAVARIMPKIRAITNTSSDRDAIRAAVALLASHES